MGSCLSKKAAKKQQEPQEEKQQQRPPSPKSSAAFTATSEATPTCTSAPAFVSESSVKEKHQPEEESVKEILPETNAKRDCEDEITEKPSTEAPLFAPAVKKNSSFKKKGSLKKEQAEKPTEEVTPLTRTSSAREDVDAILIQCGRLSRSSSGRATASSDANGLRQYSGSKRQATDDDGDGKENGVRRPSHRKSSSRDLTVTEGGTGPGSRSASRDRGSSDGKRVTGRRISPSPGRRAEPSPGRRLENHSKAGNPGRVAAKQLPTVRRGSNSGELVNGNTRTAVPSTTSRSRSPAPRLDSGAGVPQSLSRSSSRKAEQSPFRRPPGEENPIPAAVERRGNENKVVSTSTVQILDENCDAVKKDKRVALKEINGGSRNIREQLLSCRAPTTKEKETSDSQNKRKPLVTNGVEVDGEVKDEADGDVKVDGVLTQISRSRSSRRSRDQFVLAIDDAEMKGFSLPASVSKAQSILEAVADLNSSVNSNSSLRSSAESVEHGKLSANFEPENSEILREFQRNISRRNSNADWTEESAGSRLSAARPHRYIPSEEEEIMSFESSRNVTAKNEEHENGKCSASSNQGSARYFNIAPEDVLLNPYIGIKGGESSSRPNLMPVITLGKKDFQHGKRASHLQSKENANPKANSR